ncbi:MAG: F0F1 ATP synthase subunit delta [Bacteroidales bacterium]|nr:F0F1 ATP synthase subunit delta [Bacteroidales bacterium]
MNAGIISSRYADAFLRYVLETGGGERVRVQAERLLKNPEDFKASELEPELARLASLLAKNGRMGLVRFVLRGFLDRYAESRGVMPARITTAIPLEKEEEAELVRLMENQCGGRVEASSQTDPSIVGGFILEVGGSIMDASVRRQMELIRKKIVQDNNRIV